MKVVVTILGKNAQETLAKVFRQIPAPYRADTLLSDDSSTDATAEIAKNLGLKVFKNPRKPGYGSNAKNCIRIALQEGADIVVLLHSDNQYDPSTIPSLLSPIKDGKADFVLSSRLLGDKAKGMPVVRFLGNRVLTKIENWIMGTKFTDLHSGLVAIRTNILRKIPYAGNYDDYSFHTEIVVQSKYAGARFAEVGIPTRYERDRQSINAINSIRYAIRALKIVLRYFFQTKFKFG